MLETSFVFSRQSVPPSSSPLALERFRVFGNCVSLLFLWSVFKSLLLPLCQVRLNLSSFAIVVGRVVPVDTFNPQQLSTDQWVEAAKSFGAKYIIFSIDHFSGFLMWPSETNYNYSVKYTKWREGKGNILSDFMMSSKKHGLDYGFFYSVHNNWYMGVDNYTTGNALTQERYKKVVEEQMRELFNAKSPYKDPFYIWFDAGIVPRVSPNVGPIIRELAGNSLCDECPTFAGNQGLRWVGNENAMAPLPHWYAVPNGKCSMKTNDGKHKSYVVNNN